MGDAAWQMYQQQLQQTAMAAEQERQRREAWSNYYAQQHQQAQQAQQQEEQRRQAWSNYYAQQAGHAPGAQQPAAALDASSDAAPSATAAAATAYNSYANFYGAGGAVGASSQAYTQQQSGITVIGGMGGAPGMSTAPKSSSGTTGAWMRGAQQPEPVRLNPESMAQAAAAAVKNMKPPSLSVLQAHQQQLQQPQQLRVPTQLLQKSSATPSAAPNPQYQSSGGSQTGGTATASSSASGGGGGAAGPGDWPEPLRKWVERAFQQCHSDTDRSFVQQNLRSRIQYANESNTLWSNDWDREPLPDRSRTQYAMEWAAPAASLPSSLADMYSRGGGGGGGQPSRRQKRRANKASNELDAHEVAKRAKRAGRFDGQLGSASTHEPSHRWGMPAHDGVDGHDIDLDYTVVGTCERVDKKYLRLTSAPDPSTVRPEPVLKQAIEMVRAKYAGFGDERGQEQYIFLWEQMKSVRQDLTVQRIRNAFTVEVYEMHARICLEFDDQVEFRQCQAQLKQLYEEGLGSQECQREFRAYDLLYNVGKGALNNVADLMLLLSDDDRDDPHIKHALQVRAADALGHYTALFRLYASAPGHSQYVMDTFADRARLDALAVVLKAYTPAVPLSALATSLGFDDVDECAFFVEDHGVSFVADDKQLVDCKASRATLVTHSISEKEEEKRKEEQRKAEIVPISFS